MKKLGIFLVMLVCFLVIVKNDNLFAQTSTNQNIVTYYVVVHAQSTGPYNMQGLRQLVAQGLLNKNSLVWTEGMPNWVVAGTVGELSLLFVAEPPPPPAGLPPPLVLSSQPEFIPPPASPQAASQQPVPPPPPEYIPQTAPAPQLPSSPPAAPTPPPEVSQQPAPTPAFSNQPAPVSPPPSSTPPAFSSQSAPSSSQPSSTSRQQSTAAPAPKNGLISIGGGAIWDWSLRNGYSIKDMGISASVDNQNMSIGAFGFFDAKYIEADLYASYGFIKIVSKALGSTNTESGYGLLQAGLSLLGKYPFNLGSIELFPLLGADFNLAIMGTYKGETETGGAILDMSQIGFLGGLGMDIFLSNSTFLRLEGLFHLRLAYIGAMNMPGATLGMGPQVKLGIGHNF